MILIRKSPEPADWRRQRRTPGVDFDGTEKTVLRDSLLKRAGMEFPGGKDGGVRDCV